MPSRAKRLESAISYCLIATLFVITVGIFLRQYNADISRFGMQATALLPAPQQKNIPWASLVPDGFQVLSPTQTYTIDNLYEKINGKATFYLDSGFERLLTQRFGSNDKDNLWIELFAYDMKSVRSAFSVYSRQRRPEAESLPEGSPDMKFVYRTANALYMTHGNYYIELVGSAQSDQLTNATIQVARKIRANLPADKHTHIPELDIFPADNLIADSHRLYLTDTFGFDRLTDTFTARYKFNNETITTFFSKRSDPKDARDVAQSYYSFLIDAGCSAKTTTNRTLADLKAKVLDSYGTTEIVFTSGPFVAGVHEAENQKTAEKLAQTLAEKLGDLAVQQND
jgi:hypothetical protein